MGKVGTLCSGLPGCCCGRGQGGGAVREREEWGIPLVLGVLEAMVCVCLDHLVNVKPDEEEHTK